MNVVKKSCIKKVISGNCIIDASLQFVQYANEICESIVWLHITS